MAAEALPERHPGAGHGTARERWLHRLWTPVVRRVFTVLFLAVVLGLVARHARSVDWAAVGAALRAYGAGTLALAAGLAAASHALYCGYDLIGRHETGHRLPPQQVAAIGFTCYAFNLNLGSLVGGVALRYRLYSRSGLPAETITKILALSLVTNWLGYCLVAGGVFLSGALAVPPGWEIGGAGLRGLGAALLGVVAAYLGLCIFSNRREWTLRGHVLHLPSARLAALQLVLSSANWMLIGGVVWALLQQRIDYLSVLGVLLIAAVAGVIAHVPAGLGVLEAVFIALLSHRVPETGLLAALLAYRFFYYLIPLAFASLLFVGLESGARRSTESAGARD